MNLTARLRLPGRSFCSPPGGLLVWSFFARLEFATRKIVEASVLIVILRLAPVVTLVASLIFLHEILTWKIMLALALILTANLLLISKNTRLKSKPHLLPALALAVCLGLGWFFDKLVSGHYALPFYAALSFAVPSLFNAITPPLPRKFFLKEWRLSSWRIPLLAAFNVLGYYFYLLALKTGEVSKVALMISMSGILTIILGVVILRERDLIKEKCLAGTLILISLFLLQ